MLKKRIYVSTLYLIIKSAFVFYFSKFNLVEEKSIHFKKECEGFLWRRWKIENDSFFPF